MRNGRLVLDEPTTLPEGTVLDLVVDDEGDALDEADRVRLEAALEAADRSVRAGNTRDAADLIAELRARR